MTIKVVFIDREHHAHHFARCLLGFFVILFKRIFQVTKIALHSQGCRDELHGRNQLVGRNAFEYLNVLVDLLCGFGSGRRSRGLSPQCNRTRPKNCSSYTCA